MDIVVGIWSRRTHSPQQNNQSNAQKVAHIRTALNSMMGEIGARGIAANQSIQGIFVAPEYLFSHRDHGQENIGGGFQPRSLTDAHKNLVLMLLTGLSAEFPKILIVPGTIAWRTALGPPAQGERYRTASNIQQYMEHHVVGLDLQPPAVAQRGFGFKFHQTGRNKLTAYLTASQAQRTYLAQEIRNYIPNFALASSINDMINTLPRISAVAADLVQRAGLVDRQDYNRPRNLEQKLAAVRDLNVQYAMRNAAYVFLNGNVVHEYRKQGDFHEAIGAMDDTVFVPGGEPGEATIDGIDFGFEICLDHAIGFARGQSTGAKDIHILCSAMVGNRHDNRSACLGGHAIHACSNEPDSGVWQKTGMGYAFTAIPQIGGTAKIGGDSFKKYLIDCDVGDRWDTSMLFG